MTAPLHQIETAWLNVAPRAIADVVRSHPTEMFYGVAFWLFYYDYNQFLTPALGTNAESFVTSHKDEGESWSTRWVPAEWHWPVLDEACDEMKPEYASVSEAMKDAPQADWHELVKSHDQMIARVARKLTSQIREHRDGFETLTVADDFLVAAVDDQRGTNEYNALVRASVDPKRLEGVEGLIRS